MSFIHISNYTHWQIKIVHPATNLIIHITENSSLTEKYTLTTVIGKFKSFQETLHISDTTWENLYLILTVHISTSISHCGKSFILLKNIDSSR